MNPKEFIKINLIDELSDIVHRHPYLSFTFIGIGIEFLGKCMLDNKPDWHKIKPDTAFKEGLKLLYGIDKRYQNIDLQDELRHGFAHTLSPKNKIALAQIKYGQTHFDKYEGKTILVIEYLYADFVKCCNEVIRKEFPKQSKMNRQFLMIT